MQECGTAAAHSVQADTTQWQNLRSANSQTTAGTLVTVLRRRGCYCMDLITTTSSVWHSQRYAMLLSPCSVPATAGRVAGDRLRQGELAHHRQRHTHMVLLTGRMAG